MQKVTLVLCAPLGSKRRILFCLARTYSQDRGSSLEASMFTNTNAVKVSLSTRAAEGRIGKVR